MEARGDGRPPSPGASHPARRRPLLVFDGDCRVCRGTVLLARRRIGDRVDFAPSQAAASGLPQVPAERFRREVVLVEEDGRISGGAEAMFRALARKPGHGAWLLAYGRVPGAAALCEGVYRAVAAHRVLLARLLRPWWGGSLEPPTYHLSRLWFLKLLGLTYLVAFVSLGLQARALFGSHGILPIADRLASARALLGGADPLAVPTLFWISASDEALLVHVAAGIVLALVLVRGILPGPVLLLLWLDYLSLVTTGGEILSFQWDVLLLETGLLAVLLAPWGVAPRVSREPPPPAMVRWLLGLVVVKLVLGSGLVKLLSEDPMWWDLTALTVHYQTQPLPNAVAWYVHQLPEWWHRLACGAMFLVELAAPLCLVAPRRIRHGAVLAMIGLMAAVALTGNFAFFNLLAVALLVLQLDDGLLAAVTPARSVERLWRRAPGVTAPLAWRRLVMLAAIVLAVLSLGAFAAGLGLPVPDTVGRALVRAAPLRSVNAYGLFADMTESRPELVIEGSRDGETFLPYELRYKPGRLDRRPRQVAPHQPRLDWQLWFAALTPAPERIPWVRSLLRRILEGEPEVLALFAENPFPGTPPRHVRLLRYDYAFTTPDERRSTGAWWKRRPLGQAGPVLSLGPAGREARP